MPDKLPRHITARTYARWLRDAANQFRRGAEIPLGEFDLLESAGKLVIAARDAGLIPPELTDLHALVEHHLGPGPDVHPARIATHHGPARLFIDLAGGGKHTLAISTGADGRTTFRLGRENGGHVQTWLPGVIARPPHERYADAAEAIADVIEAAAEADRAAAPSTKTRRPRRPTPIPAQHQEPYKLWQTFKAECESAGQRPLIARFTAWARTKHKLEIDGKRFAKWLETYSRSARRKKPA